METFVVLVCSVLLAAAKPPQWLKTRPVDPSSYIGIAKVNKASDLDYRQKALNAALSFISSEISVVVKSTSTSVLKDTNGVIDDVFDVNSTTTTKEDLQGYELVDTWESKKEYAVYCKLSKQKYLDSRRAKFLGTLEVINTTYNTFENAVRDRNFGRAQELAFEVSKSTKDMVRGGSVLPFMSSFEIRDVTKYLTLFEDLIASTSVLVKDNGVRPFSWLGGGQLGIALVDQSKTVWNNWSGSLYDSLDTMVFSFDKQNGGVVNIPINIFIYPSANLNFKLSLTLKETTSKSGNPHTLGFSVPVSTHATLDKVVLKGVPENLKSAITNFVARFFVNSEDESPTGDAIEVNAEYLRSFSSPKWEKGLLILSFKNTSANSKAGGGVGKIETSCSGNSLEDAISRGIGVLENNFSKNKSITWK